MTNVFLVCVMIWKFLLPIGMVPISDHGYYVPSCQRDAVIHGLYAQGNVEAREWEAQPYLPINTNIELSLQDAISAGYIFKYNRISGTNLSNQVRDALHEGRVVLAAVAVPALGWRTWLTQYNYREGLTEDNDIHAVCIVGEITPWGYKYINNFGPEWGTSGFGFISPDVLDYWSFELFTFDFEQEWGDTRVWMYEVEKRKPRKEE